jgi:hypothetical protein
MKTIVRFEMPREIISFSVCHPHVNLSDDRDEIPDTDLTSIGIFIQAFREIESGVVSTTSEPLTAQTVESIHHAMRRFNIWT